jgi:hypothetical protein
MTDDLMRDSEGLKLLVYEALSYCYIGVRTPLYDYI